MFCLFDLFMGDFKSIYVVKSTVLIDVLTAIYFII